MKKIGFVDYYISEWHANNYPRWIEEANKKLGTDYQVAFAWAEQDVSMVDGVSTAEWCEKMNVVPCDTITELCEKSDVIIVLAPSNPEKHLQYAKEVLKFGKHTYIDKTFAPDFETARKIFEIAEEYHTRFFSTSALRYAEELEKFTNAEDFIITGGGGNFPEYIIHTVEMAVVLLNNPIKQVKVECVGEQRICRINTQNHAEAVILYSPALGFSITAKNRERAYIHCEVVSDFFLNLITDILRFFENGNLPFDSQQTLEAMRLRSGLLKAEQTPGKWIEL